MAITVNFSNASDAQSYLDRTYSGQEQWNDENIQVAKNYIDSKDPYKQAQKQYQEAIQPAITSLNQSIPEIQQKFAAEGERLESRREPLKQRYEALLAEVSGRAQTSVNQATKIQSDALARRGIQGGSFRETEIMGATEPIRQEERSQITNIGLSREESERQIEDLLSQLTGQETESTRAVRNAIAQLQAGAGTQALTAAQAEIARQDQLAQQKILNEIARQEADLKNLGTEASKDYEIIELGNTAYVYDPNTNQVINTLQGLKTASGGSDGW